ncbi:MAG: 4Fe-4S binding protein [Desulfobacterales bacterium]|nr:4Fe-4S binding protein [Desulfobacterales bacterium]
MIWDKDADAAIKKVPFFVRKKVRKRVETFVSDKGKNRVTLGDVQALKKKFLSKGGMESEIKGYDVSACFGGSGCPNSVVPSEKLVKDIESLMQAADILGFLKSQVKGDLKFHHEFRVSISDCPNACSRPQITDIGIIGAALPGITDEPCSACEACVEICPENAVVLDGAGPEIDAELCLSCGKCIKACPTGTINTAKTGYRVLLGGRLGRHPRLGMEVPGLFSHEELLHLVRRCLEFYKANSEGGRRFSHVLESLSQII